MTGITGPESHLIRTVKPEYGAHSFSSSQPGAWVVKGLMYIHAGPGTGQLSGSNGCVELVGDNQFNAFNNAIFRLAGLGNSGKTASQMMVEIAKAGILTVNFEKASKPSIVHYNP